MQSTSERLALAVAELKAAALAHVEAHGPTDDQDLAKIKRHTGYWLSQQIAEFDYAIYDATRSFRLARLVNPNDPEFAEVFAGQSRE